LKKLLDKKSTKMVHSVNFKISRIKKKPTSEICNIFEVPIPKPPAALRKESEMFSSQDVSQYKPYIAAAIKRAENGDFSSAVKQFEIGLRFLNRLSQKSVSKMERAKIYEQYSQCLMEDGLYNRALDYARVAVELAPTWAVAWQTKYRTELQWGDPDEALSSAKHCLELSTDTEFSNEVLEEVREIEQICDKKKSKQANDVSLSKRNEYLRAIEEGRNKGDKEAVQLLKKASSQKSVGTAQTAPLQTADPEAWGRVMDGDEGDMDPEFSDEKEPLPENKTMDIDA